MTNMRRAAAWQTSKPRGADDRDLQGCDRQRSATRRRAFCLFRTASLLAAPLWAQNAPDAGALRQQLEREHQAFVGGIQSQARDIPQVDFPPSGPTVVVKNFKFAGYTLLGDAHWTSGSAGTASLAF